MSGIILQNSAQETISLGGHAAFTLLDGVYGVSSVGTKADTSSDYAGFNFLKIIFFVRSALSEKISVDIRPIIALNGIDGTTGASPQLGVHIGKQRANKAKYEISGFTRATATYVLPTSTEISIGYLNSRFTWEYGNELFWEDEMNGSQFACNPWLGNFTDVGLEIVHYLDYKDSSIPIYGYLLNGSDEQENNVSPMALVVLEPQIGAVRFHLALAGGTWDPSDEYGVLRSSAGLGYSYKKFAARVEESIGFWEKRIHGSPDNILAHGGYVKLSYTFAQMLRATLGLSYAYHNFAHIYNPEPGEEVYYSLIPAVQWLTSSSSRVIIQADINSWKQQMTIGPVDKTYLRFIRGTVGWRITF